jgi:hypothetical protein
MEFFKSEKSFRILNISGFWYIFKIFRIPLVSTSLGHAKCLEFFSFSVHFCGDLLYVGTLAGKVAALCMACKGTYKWNFSDLKKVPES